MWVRVELHDGLIAVGGVKCRKVRSYGTEPCKSLIEDLIAYNSY